MSKKTNRRALSPYKEGFCPFCHIEIELGLSHRRGDILIECPECTKTFTVNDLENFMKTVSDIVEGDCPNCSTTLMFTISERLPDASIHCRECKENFFLDEVEKPIKKTEEGRKEERQTVNPSTVSSLYLWGWFLATIGAVILPILGLGAVIIGIILITKDKAGEYLNSGIAIIVTGIFFASLMIFSWEHILLYTRRQGYDEVAAYILLVFAVLVVLGIGIGTSSSKEK